MNWSKSVFHCFHSLSFILVQKETNADGTINKGIGEGGSSEDMEVDQVGSELRDKAQETNETVSFYFILSFILVQNETNTDGKTERHINSNGEGDGSIGSGDENMEFEVQLGGSEPGNNAQEPEKTDVSDDKIKPNKEDKKEEEEKNTSDNLNQIVIEEISENEEVRRNEKDGNKDENKLNQKNTEKVEKERKEEKEDHEKEEEEEKATGK